MSSGIPDLSSASFIQRIVHENPDSKENLHSHIAFDLDGVLIDSLSLMKESWTTAKKDSKGLSNNLSKPMHSISENHFLLYLEISEYQNSITNRFEKDMKTMPS